MRVIVVCILIYFFYWLVQTYFAKHWDKNLSVRIFCESEYAYEGDELCLIEEMENRKCLILPAVTVKFTTSKYWEFLEQKEGATTDRYYRNDVFSVGTNERIRRKLPFVCKKRGYYPLGDMEVFAWDFFYEREYMKRVKNEQWVFVFAKRVRTPQLEDAFRHMLGEVMAKTRLYEDPFTFSGIRDYQSYDTVRRINWKASAKTGQWKVNCYEYTAELSVNILLFFEQKNVDWDKDMEEYVLSLAVTMAEKFLGQRINVSLKSNGLDAENGRMIELGVGSGEHHMRRIDEAIARINLLQTEKALESAESFLERGMQEDGINLLITSYCSKRMQQILKEKASEGYDFFWLLPHYEMDLVSVEEGLGKQLVEIVAHLE